MSKVDGLPLPGGGVSGVRALIGSNCALVSPWHPAKDAGQESCWKTHGVQNKHLLWGLFRDQLKCEVKSITDLVRS